MRRHLSGFTLIELMIVVAIIAILAAIAFPAYNNYRKAAAETACLAEMKGYANLALVTLFDNQAPPQAPKSACETADDATAVGTSISASPHSPGSRTTTCSMESGGQGTCTLN